MEERQPRKLAVILHADVVGSTGFVQQDEALAHERIQDVFHRFSQTIQRYGGIAHELRGDALVAEFERASDAVEASLAFQAENTQFNSTLEDAIQPTLRIGISLGEVVIADNTVTGEGIVLAQRLERLASSGGVCIQGAVYEAVPGRWPFDYESLGEQELKGISEPVRAYMVSLKSGETIPAPEARALPSDAQTDRPKHRWMLVGTMALLVIVAGGLAWLQPWVPREEPASIERMAFPLPDKPSIAVLPFDNMSDDADQEYFVDGMTEDLITDLSKLSGLFVIARNSTFAYKGEPINVRQVAEELGVRYVLEGSLRRVDDQVRINAQLIDAVTGAHLWADRYDGAIGDVFALQDRVTQDVVSALEVELTPEDEAHQIRKETDNADAYDALLRGKEHHLRYTVEDYAIAIPYLEKAIALDPKFVRAHEWLMVTYWEAANNEWAQGLDMSTDEAFAKAKHHQEEALALGATPLTYFILSKMLTNEGRHDEAIAEAQRMVAINPNNLRGYQALARALNKAGRWAEGLDAATMLVRLDPKTDEKVGWWSWRVGESQYHTEDYEGALKSFLKVTEIAADEWGDFFLAAVYGQLGRTEEAKKALQVFETKRAKLGHDHPYTLADLGNWNFKYGSDRERLRDGLRKAGMPEGASASTELDVATAGIASVSPEDVEGATTIDAAEAKALVDTGVAVVDVRGTDWSTGHIPGALNLDVYREFTEDNLSASVSKDAKVVIYGRSTGPHTARACARAVSWGFEQVYYFREGFTGWKAAGYPVVVPPK